MGLLDDINAQAQAQESKSETFVPPFMNNESDGSDVTSQVLNYGNTAEGNQAISDKGSSDNGLQWYFDNRNLHNDRRLIMNPEISLQNEPQDSNNYISDTNEKEIGNYTLSDTFNVKNILNNTIPLNNYDLIYLHSDDIPGITCPIYLENQKNKKIADEIYQKWKDASRKVKEEFMKYTMPVKPKSTEDPFNYMTANDVVNSKNIFNSKTEHESIQSILDKKIAKEKLAEKAAEEAYKKRKMERFFRVMNKEVGELGDGAKEYVKWQEPIDKFFWLDAPRALYNDPLILLRMLWNEPSKEEKELFFKSMNKEVGELGDGAAAFGKYQEAINKFFWLDAPKGIGERILKNNNNDKNK